MDIFLYSNVHFFMRLQCTLMIRHYCYYDMRCVWVFSSWMQNNNQKDDDDDYDDNDTETTSCRGYGGVLFFFCFFLHSF